MTTLRTNDDPSTADPPPRGLLLLAAAWVGLSLLVAFGTRPPLLATASTYAPAVRIALMTLLAGAIVGWPLLRLSGPSPRRPTARMLLDLLVVMGSVQVLLWPLRLTTPWTIERTTAIATAFLGWLLVAAAPTLWGIARTSASARAAAMGGLVLLLLSGLLVPIAAAMQPGRGDLSPFDDPIAARWQPFLGLFHLCQPAASGLGPSEWMTALVPVLLGTLLLSAVLLSRPRRPEGTPPPLLGGTPPR